MLPAVAGCCCCSLLSAVSCQLSAASCCWLLLLTLTAFAATAANCQLPVVSCQLAAATGCCSSLLCLLPLTALAASASAIVVRPAGAAFSGVACLAQLSNLKLGNLTSGAKCCMKRGGSMLCHFANLWSHCCRSCRTPGTWTSIKEHFIERTDRLWEMHNKSNNTQIQRQQAKTHKLQETKGCGTCTR